MTALQFVTSLNPFTTAGERGRSTSADRRLENLFLAYEQRVFTQTNQLFWWLLVSQWAFSVLVALIWSPRAWSGAESTIHPHLIAALVVGGLLVVPPLLLARALPFHPVSRHVIAVAQVSFSALLIHLTGGRIETHFHVFGSLAFLALYRDWRVLITATLVVALDHLLRGIWYPLSVYGVPYATAWRTVEHALWVVFEDVVLVWACIVSRREMGEICVREDQNGRLLDELEQRVRDRTAALENEMVGRERTAAELRQSEERYRSLVANIPIGIFETTATGEVRFANPYLLRLVGLPPDTDLSTLNLADGRTFSPAERQRLWLRLEAEGEVRGFETTYLDKDGTPIEVVINARLKPNGPGEPPSSEGTLEDVTAQKRTQRELANAHQQLVVASRQAGMAEVATGVLHNVGNVLTSVNTTTQCMLDLLRTSRLRILRRVVETFQRERPRLGVFLTEDATGKQIPDFLAKLETHLIEEQVQLRTNMESLVRHFCHIREIIVTQQSSARLLGANENLAPAQLFEDALKLGAESLQRHGIHLVREFAPVGSVRADRHKVLQILVNLLKNAKDAVMAANLAQPCITVRLAPVDAHCVALVVADNGLGIAPENVTRIFQHGFTTKADGHGFGLHSCVLAAREMQGDLAVASAGPGRGATFTLTLPIADQ
jgi:PAS domain S-box-containing protein